MAYILNADKSIFHDHHTMIGEYFYPHYKIQNLARFGWPNVIRLDENIGDCESFWRETRPQDQVPIITGIKLKQLMTSKVKLRGRVYVAVNYTLFRASQFDPL